MSVDVNLSGMRSQLLLSILFGALLAVFCQSDGTEAGQDSAPRRLVITSAKAAILEKGGETTKLSLKVLEPFLSGKSLGIKDDFEVTVEVTDGQDASFKPQQVMLLFKDAASGAAAYALPKKQKSGGISIVMSHASFSKQVGGQQVGPFEVVLLVGHPGLEPLSWNMGTMEVTGLSSTPGPFLSATSQKLTFTKPTIEHLFRKPEKRPAALVSSAFTFLAILPFVFLLATLGSTGANLKGFPTGTSGLYALLFTGGLAALLGVYLLFWFKLNLAQTMPLVGLLGSFTAVFGYKTLQAIPGSDEQAKKDKKDQ